MKVIEQRLPDHRAGADHEVEHTCRNAGAGDDLGQRMRRARHQLGRLEHHGVAVAEGRRDLPGRDGDGEVPRRDDADDADGLARDLNADAGTDRGDRLARKAQRLAGEELEDLPGAGRFADALGQGLALFTAEQRAELLAAGEDLVGGLAQDGMSLQEAGARPHGERRLGRRDRPGRIGGTGAGVVPDDLIGIGGVDVGNALAIDPFAVDEVFVQVFHGHVLWCSAHPFSQLCDVIRAEVGITSPP